MITQTTIIKTMITPSNDNLNVDKLNNDKQNNDSQNNDHQNNDNRNKELLREIRSLGGILGALVGAKVSRGRLQSETTQNPVLVLEFWTSTKAKILEPAESAQKLRKVKKSRER